MFILEEVKGTDLVVIVTNKEVKIHENVEEVIIIKSIDEEFLEIRSGNFKVKGISLIFQKVTWMDIIVKVINNLEDRIQTIPTKGNFNTLITFDVFLDVNENYDILSKAIPIDLERNDIWNFKEISASTL